MQRRDYLYLTGGLTTVGLAGCVDLGETIDELPRPVIGNEDASVTVDVFDDYMCPACQDYVQNTYPVIHEDYIQEDLIEYRHYDWPIPVNSRWSYELANAARGVQYRYLESDENETDDEFFTVKSELYEIIDGVSTDAIREVVEDNTTIDDVGDLLDEASNTVYQPVIDEDVAIGNERGVGRTPTIFVNDTQLPAFDLETVTNSIDAALEE